MVAMKLFSVEADDFHSKNKISQRIFPEKQRPVKNEERKLNFSVFRKESFWSILCAFNRASKRCCGIIATCVLCVFLNLLFVCSGFSNRKTDLQNARTVQSTKGSYSQR